MPPKYHISKTEGPTRTKQFAKVPFELQSRTWELTSNLTSEYSCPSGLKAFGDDEQEEEKIEANSGTHADQNTDSSTIASKEPVRMRGGLASAAARRSAPSTGASRKRSREGDDSENDSGHYPSESEKSEEEGEEKEESVSEGVPSTSTSPGSSSTTNIGSTSKHDAAQDPSDNIETEQTPVNLRDGQLESAAGRRSAPSTGGSRYHDNDAANESDGDSSVHQLHLTTNGPLMPSTAQKKPGSINPIGAMAATNNTASHR
ncbi:hypothetical protein IFR04_003948 [Cadophora malorum]|uniref:Uncharacterized protein n=1 Tax=Cadophora malorum TaxID=108018 RepID=A0A8H7WDI1_9HELO|nr:hypothetical protein IFR04_003948 [Cadophora malorum]